MSSFSGMTCDCGAPQPHLRLARDTSINNMRSSAFLFKGLASLILLALALFKGPASLRVQFLLPLLLLLLVLLLFLAMLLFLLLIWVLFLEQVPVI